MAITKLDMEDVFGGDAILSVYNNKTTAYLQIKLSEIEDVMLLPDEFGDGTYNGTNFKTQDAEPLLKALLYMIVKNAAAAGVGIDPDIVTRARRSGRALDWTVDDQQRDEFKISISSDMADINSAGE